MPETATRARRGAATVLLLGALILAAPAAAQDFETGVAAFQGGDYAQALEVWTPLAEAGHAPAQYSLGFLFGAGLGVAPDPTRAAHWHRLAAEQGHAESQFILGTLLLSGDGIETDAPEALRLFRLAAEEGHVEAQYSLGLAYARGEAVARDYAEAGRWLGLAGASGHTLANDVLGVMRAAGFVD